MTDRENFLERWSRRKIEAERQTPDDGREDVAARAPEANEDDKASASAPAASPRSDEAAASFDAKPVFDITQLPSLESITAATDVRAFLAPGVPTELARAALRRAWAADPAIRDFKGLAENDWDFTDPTAMPGFTDLPGDYDVKKLITQIFGEKDKTVEAPPSVEPDRTVASMQPSAQAKEIASAEESEQAALEDSPTEKSAKSGDIACTDADLVQRNNNTAPHNSNLVDEKEEAKTRRPHGRALPQ